MTFEYNLKKFEHIRIEFQKKFENSFKKIRTEF